MTSAGCRRRSCRPPSTTRSATRDGRSPSGCGGSDVPTRWTEYAGMPHGYLTLPGVCRSAPQAVAEIVQELRAHLLDQPADGALGAA
jgi:hypothetical protein